MKAILIPIQPLDCELISKRKKRVIVTKRKPTLETPFKCYIYETRHGSHSCKIAIRKTIAMLMLRTQVVITVVARL